MDRKGTRASLRWVVKQPQGVNSQDMPKFHVCAQIHMPRCFIPCSCLDLLVYVLLAILLLRSTCYVLLATLLLRSTCLCAPFHALAQIFLFMCSLPCSCLDLLLCVLNAMFMCLDLHVGCYAFYFLLSIFLAFWPFGQGVDLDLVVQAYIHTPRPISKGLDHFLYACLCFFACFYALSQCLPIYIQALPCFVRSVGLCLSVFEATYLCGCICPSSGLFGCDHS